MQKKVRDERPEPLIHGLDPRPVSRGRGRGVLVGVALSQDETPS